MKPDKPTTPDGQPLRYGACRCDGRCFWINGEGTKVPFDERIGWCLCHCHEWEYRKMKENKEDGK